MADSPNKLAAPHDLRDQHAAAPPTDPELESQLHSLNAVQSLSSSAVDSLQQQQHQQHQQQQTSRTGISSRGAFDTSLSNDVEGHLSPAVRSAGHGLEQMEQLGQVDITFPSDGMVLSTPHGTRHSQHPDTQMPETSGHQFVSATNNDMQFAPFTQHPLPQNMIPHFQTPTHPNIPQAGSSIGEGHFKNMKSIPNPPDLQKWREKLFNVEDTIVMSEEEFQTYFPHVDNVYSHRSTQRYKRKPFVSHYWDCRLKGRPPGTPKTHDPNKKKRKRTARERNLCDVKIKITEYFPGAMTASQDLSSGFEQASQGTQQSDLLVVPGSSNTHLDGSQPFGVLTPSATLPPGHPGVTGARYYTIQRVNGNGGNGRSDSVEGPHRHTLEESDRIKKNSVQRNLLKEEKGKKKSIAQQKSYHSRASGYAYATVKKHMKESDLKLYGSCFCPFVQRVWVALEVKDIPYQYIEIDPYKKPDSLLEVNPRGLVPAIRHGNWGCYESSVLLEYLEDLDIGKPLLPPGDPQLRAHCRLWVDHINRHIIPCFYRLLQEQDLAKQISYTEQLKDHISKLVNASHVHGPFFLGRSISFVDIHFAPWMLRLTRVLKPYRGWPDPERGSRWAAWMEAVELDEHVMATTSSDDLYLDSYQRYAGE
ncbi:putative glutathione transferase [Microsporum audouinii]